MDLYRVLIADADGEHCRDLEAAFVHSGYFLPVAATSSGVSVARLAEIYKPDALVLDVNMPGSDGISILRTLHKKGIRPMTVVETSLPSTYVTSSLCSLGVAYMMEKPCACDAVVERMTEILEMYHGPLYRAVPLEYKDLSALTMKFLREVGIPYHVAGYGLLLSAILLTAQRPELITGVTKALYPMVARAHNSTASRAERNIRSAIQAAWKERPPRLVELFAQETEGLTRPTSSHFIEVLARQVVRMANESTVTG